MTDSSPVIPMTAWVRTFMTELRRAWQRYLLQSMTGLDADRARHKRTRDNAYIVSVLGLPGGSSVPDGEFFSATHQELCYNLCCNADATLRVEGRKFVHVSLTSVAEWFHLHGGWRLDACAAMLFSRACARRMDAGRSWMVNGGHFHALECHILMEDAQMFALQMVRAGREAELLGAMRRRFGAEWTSMTYTKNYTLFNSIVPRPHLRLADHSYHCMRDHTALARDILALRSRLIEEVQAEATQEEAVAILTRKLNACLPMSKLTQSAA